MSRIPVDTLYQINVVVRDARAMALNYAELYGIERWQVRHYTPGRLGRSELDGQAAEYGYLAAAGSNEVGGVSFQLIQPLEGESSFSRFLNQRGQGVHSIALAELSPSELSRLLPQLAEDGIPAGQRETVDGAAEVCYLDTNDYLGGFYVQVTAAETGNWRDKLRVDEEWDFRKEIKRPAKLDLVRKMSAVNHFGVVVRDLGVAVERFALLFGAARWRGYHWTTEQGKLEQPTNNGHDVKHSYRTARGNIGRNPLKHGFGFEIIEPEAGPLHFRDQFLDVAGPGIHHLSLSHQIKDAFQWVEFNQWLDGLAPTCMSGWVRDHSGMFIYKDTTALLGYVIEIGIQSNTRHEPDLWYDFSQQLSAGT